MLSADFFQYIAQTSPEPISLKVERAEGIYLHLEGGQKVIDFISGICVNHLGHGVPEVIAAIQQQAALYLHPNVYGDVDMGPQTQYGKQLCSALGAGFEQVYFLPSGAEAVEGALKIAKKFTGRTGLVAFHGSYHGSTHGALSVTGSDWKKEGYGPLLPDVSFLNFNKLEELKGITQQTAAVIVEPIQAACGILLPEAGFLQTLRKRCTETGTLLIFDEIQTAFGRVGGKLFAFQKYGVQPDIILLAKALGGGMPLGAFATSREIMSCISHNPILGHITTFGGHAVCCAAGLAAFNLLTSSDLCEQVATKEAWLRHYLKLPRAIELRGEGLLYALLFEDFATADRVRRRALELGLLSIGFLNAENGLRLSPPLTISEKEMKEACDILMEAIEWSGQ